MEKNKPPPQWLGAFLCRHIKGMELSVKKFRVDKILSCFAGSKKVAVLGHYDACEAVIVLEQVAFDRNVEEIQALLDDSVGLTCDFANAEYNYCKLIPKNFKIKCDIICPATAKHILKFSESECRMIRETPEVYSSVVLPYVESHERGDRIAWVHNILDKKKEQDRILFEDPDPVNGFVLLPDSKWELGGGGLQSTLYCLAIVNRRDLLSIRSLTGEHLALLQNILEKGCETIMERFKVPREKLRIFFHYHPTFYHLHVHFCHLQFDNPVPDVQMLQTVIENIQLVPNYYQKVSLMVKVRTTLDIYSELCKAGVVQGTAEG